MNCGWSNGVADYLGDVWNTCRSIYAKALKCGVLIRPEKCPLCGSKHCIIGHHQNYSKPLKVNWLCQHCHTIIHGCLWELYKLAVKNKAA